MGVMTAIAGGFAQDLLVDLDRDADKPLHRQIESSIKRRVTAGLLTPGTPLPATRGLAADLGVSRGVVVEAYEQLVAEGFLVATRGSYTRVAAPAVSTGPSADAAGGTEDVIDFEWGRSDPASFPRGVWLSSVRRILNETPHNRLSYLDGTGVPEFRIALASYLNRTRGTEAHPDTLIACAGFAQGVNLVLTVLQAQGARTLAVEDPSAGDDSRVLAATLGMKVVGIAVDDTGWDVAALERSDADVVVLTPSHQWPVGAVMDAETRTRVIRWARQRDAILVEDDYDAEFRYDRPPTGALQGRAPERVIYAGTASKTLTPGLRLGWMVAPPRLVQPLAAAKLLADRGSPAIDQLAFADFVEHGEFDRHLRRTRPLYRRRRDALVDALRAHLPDIEVAGVEAGQHLVGWLPDGLDEESVQSAAAASGVRIHGVSEYRLAGRGSGRPGLIFGYSALTDRRIAEGVRRLAGAVQKDS
jgi:GntR family transcriptional regulator / MocR family aminotransferase